MSTQVEAELQLAIDAALINVGKVDAALNSTVERFRVGLASALDVLKTSTPPTVPVKVDTSSVTADLKDALGQAADLTVPVKADTGEITPAIDEAVAAASPDVTITADVTADTTPAESSIDALSGATVDAVVAADVADATETIDSLRSSEEADPITLSVEADTAGATDSVKALGDAGTSASQGIGSAETAIAGAEIAAGALDGKVGPLAAKLGVVGSVSTIAAGGVKELFDAGLSATTAMERLRVVAGPLADELERVNVGGLNTDLKDLAIQAGSSDVALTNAAAKIAQLGKSSGASDQSIVRVTQEIEALAARAVVLNPALGDAGSVAESMALKLQRGGRFAASFGLDLTSAEVAAKALADTGKQSASELDVFEKTAAAADLATSKLGKSLATDLAAGSQNATIQLRSIEEQVKQTFEALGEPLVVPVLDTMRAGVPIVSDFGQVFAEVGKGALPVVRQLLADLEPVVSGLTPAVSAFTDQMQAVEPILEGIEPLLQALGPLLNLVGEGLKVFTSITFTPVKVLGEGLEALTSGVAGLVGAEDTGKPKIDAFSTALEHQGKSLADTASAAKDAITAANFPDLVAQLGTLGISVQQYRTALSGSFDAQQNFLGLLNQFRLQGGAAAAAADKVAFSFASMSAAQENNVRTALVAAAASDRITRSQLEGAIAAAGIADATQFLNSVLAGTQDVIPNVNELASQLDKLNASVAAADPTPIDHVKTSVELLGDATNVVKGELDAFSTSLDGVTKNLDISVGIDKVRDSAVALGAAVIEANGNLLGTSKASEGARSALADYAKSLAETVKAQEAAGASKSALLDFLNQQQDAVAALAKKFPELAVVFNSVFADLRKSVNLLPDTQQLAAQGLLAAQVFADNVQSGLQRALPSVDLASSPVFASLIAAAGSAGEIAGHAYSASLLAAAAAQPAFISKEASDRAAAFGTSVGGTAADVKKGADAASLYSRALEDVAKASGSAKKAQEDLVPTTDLVRLKFIATLPPIEQVNLRLLALGERGKQIADGIKTGAIGLDDFAKIAQETGISVDDLISLFNATSDAAKKLGDKSVEALNRLADSFLAGLPKMGDAFRAFTEDQKKAGDDAVANLNKDATEADKVIVRATAEAGVGLGDFLANVQQQTADIASFLADLQTLVARGATSLAEAFAQQGIGAADLAKQAVALGDQALAQANDVVKKSQDQNDTASKIASDLAAKITDATTTGVDKGIAGATDPAKKSAGELGAAIAASIAAGTLKPDSIALVRQAGQQISDVLVDAVKAALQISSPSKVMMALGEFTLDGFIRGVSRPDKLALTADAGRALAGTFASSALPGVGAAAGTSSTLRPLAGSADSARIIDLLSQLVTVSGRRGGAGTNVINQSFGGGGQMTPSEAARAVSLAMWSFAK